MTEFKLPFSIDHPNHQEFILAKCYEEKRECYKLTVPKGKKLNDAVHIKFRNSEGPLELSLGIELQENSAVTIIEEWSDDIKTRKIQFSSHIKCDTASSLKYVVLNVVSQEAIMTENRTSNVAMNANCHILSYYFGTKKMDSRLIQKTTGLGAKIDTDIITSSQKNQDLSFYCKHDYAAKMGSGEIIMKGIVQDKALLNFDGMVNIRQTGGGSAGYLKQEALNLSPETTVRAIPGLKIDTNDVKAGHSAAIRNLNEEDLYYFGARGIDRNRAKKILITGFLGKEIQKIEKYKTAYETVRKLI